MTGRPNGNIMVKFAFVCVLVILVFAVVNMQMQLSELRESKKQLEIAIQMDPDNSKYKDEYEKLKNKMAYNEKQFHSGNASSSGGDRQMGGTDASGCVSCCAYYLCTDMLCHCCCR